MPDLKNINNVGLEEVANDMNVPCCPELDKDSGCDYLDFHYRLKHPKTIKIGNSTRVVTVEVLIAARLERCQGALALGDLVYSTTLLPGERVRLFSMDRRSKFSFDRESSMSYRHAQASEERYYMSSMSEFMSKITTRDRSASTSRSSSSFESEAGTSGLFETIFSGPSVDVSGSHSASSSRSFMRELTQHAQSSHNRSVQATRLSNSVSIGEVQSRTHTEGETEDHFESSSRLFQNKNKCHAVTYLFYQLNKKQTIRFKVLYIRRRVIDPVTDTKVSPSPYIPAGKVSVVPSAVLATDVKRLELEDLDRQSTTANVRLANAEFQARQPFGLYTPVGSADEPIPENFKAEALKQVDEDLVGEGILDAKTRELNEEIRQEFSFEYSTSIPTTGIIVKGCLDRCDTCEPTYKREIYFDLENKKLQNELLRKQIELLEKSQEYRCCPAGQEEDDAQDAGNDGE
ncbi:MAG: hypothetical protein DWQ05_14955 [Calditrichaeota bacterium]|nr:MAG: hypothetical protein DWQ05_14955 [Calditrichota bacterium]